MMKFVLVSSCLLGKPVRYNGTHKLAENEILSRWLSEGRVISVCPELAGGMPVPRPPAEIIGGGGMQVLSGLARVVDAQGNDVSRAFVAGSVQTLQQAKLKNIRVAILKEDSPSCGSSSIYDGSFTGIRIQEQGVTAALLESEGIRVFNEKQFAQAEAYLCGLENEDSE
jgi:uncharacterized protein YbbK (DUF523 family)